MTRATLLLALLAAGCATSHQPMGHAGAAPVCQRTQDHRPPASSSAGNAAAGETPPTPGWEDGEGTPLSAYALRPEETQPFDPARPPRTHRVGPNESLYDIATRYQIPLRALIEQNHLEPPYVLTPGRELELPPPRFHVVARGESFEDVAERYNVDPRSLALLNRLQPPYRVRPGDRLVLPALARAHAEAPAPAHHRPFGAATLRPGARFAMPLHGEVAARFGVQPNGVRLDGVEIVGREGASVVAAADGEVVYAGDDLPAYGTLILVRHADNYVTAYGFTRRALVREGQHVRAGQPIAELGSHPDGGARLLFQVRQGSTPVDPAPLLGIRD